MELSLKLNGKHESYVLTAFFEYIKNSGHQGMTAVFTKSDLRNKEGSISLQNLPLSTYQIGFFDRIVYSDLGNETILKDRK